MIIFDERVAIFLKRYQKKEKIIRERKLLFDKNNLLLNYSLFENQGFARKYLFPELFPILGLVGCEEGGMCGVEQSLEKKLLSPARYKTMRVFSGKDQAGYVLSSETNNRFNLSIDAPQSLSVFYLLKQVVEKYNSNFGCCIIMNGTTGEIESYVQFPFYNPQNKETDLSFLYPLGVTQAYEVGSVVKAFLMLAALEEGVVLPETLVNCYGVKEKKFKNRIISTWKAHGLISFKDVIEGSNNIGVAQVGLKIGNKLYDYYKKCGFGEVTGIEICGEHKAILHHPDSCSRQSVISFYLELFGRIAQAQRNYEKAERLYRQALKANQNGMGENPGVTRELLFNQANLAHDRGQYEEAIQLYAQVAQLIEKKSAESIRTWALVSLGRHGIRQRAAPPRVSSAWPGTGARHRRHAFES